MDFMRIPKPMEILDDLLPFVFSIYRATGGDYPRLEWLKDKPSADGFSSFRKVYEPFLRYRLEEFDELYVMRFQGDIIATFALVYSFSRGVPWWIPHNMTNALYLEFLMVSPAFQGRGIARGAVEIASKIADEKKKPLRVVTFSNLRSYGFYESLGFRRIAEHGEFVILEK